MRSLAALLLVACSSDPTIAPDVTAGDAGPALDGAPAGDAEAPAADAGPIDWTVNGHALGPREQAALTVVAVDVVPRLEGAREDRLVLASRGAWWALKEGTWEKDLPGVYAYSNCNSASGDAEIGPTEVCGSGRAWQVGLAAVQVPGHTLSELEASLPKLFPGLTADAVLRDVATKAAEPAPAIDAIAASSGSLRVSWLLRVPAVGFEALVPEEVVVECIDGAKSWCFGTGWDETKKFAPTKPAAMQSMTDLHRILAALAP